jgi:hypothetical protein
MWLASWAHAALTVKQENYSKYESQQNAAKI